MVSEESTGNLLGVKSYLIFRNLRSGKYWAFIENIHQNEKAWQDDGARTGWVDAPRGFVIEFHQINDRTFINQILSTFKFIR